MLLFKFISNSLTSMIIEDPSFLVSGYQFGKRSTRILLFLLYFYSKYKEFSLCGIELKSQPVQIGFVTVEAVAGNICSVLFS